MFQTFVFEYASYGDIPQELFYRGVISFILTMVNIICIVMVGVLILLVKQVSKFVQICFSLMKHVQVTPKSIPQRNAAFWKKDILLNREYEKSLQETNFADVSTH